MRDRRALRCVSADSGYCVKKKRREKKEALKDACNRTAVLISHIRFFQLKLRSFEIRQHKK